MAGKPRTKTVDDTARADKMLSRAIDWIAVNDEPEQSQWENLTVISKQKAVVLAAQLFEMRPEEVAFRVIDSRNKAGTESDRQMGVRT